MCGLHPRARYSGCSSASVVDSPQRPIERGIELKKGSGFGIILSTLVSRYF